MSPRETHLPRPPPRRRSAALAIGLSLIVVVGCASTAAVRPPRFVEEAGPAGLAQVYDGDWEFYVGGGVAVFDCNADGRPDLFVAGGQNPAALYRNDSLVGATLRFTHLTDPAVGLEAVTGAYPVAIDGDGNVDLAVLRVGENVLLRGRGDCRFERANEAWGFAGGDAWTTAFSAHREAGGGWAAPPAGESGARPGRGGGGGVFGVWVGGAREAGVGAGGDAWTTAFSAHWEAGRGWPTLAVGNYVDRSRPGAPFGTCHDNVLYRPADGGRGFAAPVPLTPGYCTLSTLFSDWNRSGACSSRASGG